ncbi:MAG: hypothetical protein NT084_10840 [Bacteroidetes bacterium]|nr:hypothetical protein [Bacteroidota bacterium]
MNQLNRKASLILTLSAFFFCLFSQAQSGKDNSATSGGRTSTYTTGIGLRGGFEGGVTFKHFLKSTSAVEGIITRGWGYGGFRLTGLYEIQKSLPNTKILDWYWGLGAHIGSYNGLYYGYYGSYSGGYYDSNHVWHNTGYRSHYTTIGIDGIVGVEYQFTDVPVIISADLKPYFDLYGRGSHYVDGAFSIRYVLK